jgi:hypothetical protein
VNGVPVANQYEDEQENGDQQQAGSFRRISCVPLMLVGRIVLALSVRHEDIVRSTGSFPLLGTTRDALGGCKLFRSPLRVFPNSGFGVSL